MSRAAVRSLDDLLRLAEQGSRVLCLFSGGLDGAFLLATLAERKPRSVAALTVDLGGDVDLDAARMTCEQIGVRPLCVDKAREFAEELVAPSIAAQATYL